MNQDLNLTTARDVLELISILKAKAKAERGAQKEVKMKTIGRKKLIPVISSKKCFND